MSVGAIIVAGGRGLRLGGDTPKQFVALAGRPMLRHSVEAFDRHPAVGHLVVVLPAGLVADGPALVGATARPCQFVAGGARRQDSVRHGVAALPAEVDRVLVHDAARPFVTPAVIDRVLEGMRTHAAVVPAIAARDTVKRVDRRTAVVAATLPRDEIWLAQTPQGFQRAALDAAVALGAGRVEATDEATLVERAGHRVGIVEGDGANVKITTAGDLEAARARLAPLPAVGTGYDLHRLVDGRPLRLAGVVVSAERGPLAHSDGDVVCHALIDAILGAAGLGDIGRHFPNTDPRWKDAPGLALLARAVEMTRDAGWRVANADATVVLERPKLAPHVPAMQAALAGVLGVDPARVSVKAKTNEGVDAVGRGEAIAAHAVALVVPAAG
jgi:2-C-methyl-D-erythritol 4-phosphate cytidylyltransferase/2-C-methyl-D-erythritol 2,4-cyclodiphosphate synthase